MHRRCAGGTIRAKRREVDLRDELANRDAQISSLQRRIEREREAALEVLRREKHREDDRDSLRLQVLELQGEVMRLQREVTSERNQRALAELQARSHPVAQPPPQTQDEQISSEPVDITAARFSLLELD